MKKSDLIFIGKILLSELKLLIEYVHGRDTISKVIPSSGHTD